MLVLESPSCSGKQAASASTMSCDAQRIKQLESEGWRQSANKIFTDLAHRHMSRAGQYGESRARRRG
jgi:hypothetical protein